MNFLMFKLVLEKEEEPEIKLPTSAGSSKKQESSRKPSISALLTMPAKAFDCVDHNKLWKILKDDAVKVLHSICQQIWKTQQWPQDWKRSVFIRIPKKGNAKERSNYRTIALISHASKVMLNKSRLPLFRQGGATVGLTTRLSAERDQRGSIFAGRLVEAIRETLIRWDVLGIF